MIYFMICMLIIWEKGSETCSIKTPCLTIIFRSNLCASRTIPRQGTWNGVQRELLQLWFILLKQTDGNDVDYITLIMSRLQLKFASRSKLISFHFSRKKCGWYFIIHIEFWFRAHFAIILDCSRLHLFFHINLKKTHSYGIPYEMINFHEKNDLIQTSLNWINLMDEQKKGLSKLCKLFSLHFHN